MAFLGGIGEIAIEGLAGAWERRRNRRRLDDIRQGRVVEISCRLGVGSAKARPGVLVLTEGPITWRARTGADRHDLRGYRLRPTPRRFGNSRVRLERPGGPELVLQLLRDDAWVLGQLMASPPTS